MDRDYQIGQMRASGGRSGTRDERIELPAVLASDRARAVVEEALARRHRAGGLVKLSLSPSYMSLRAGEPILLSDSGMVWTARSVTVAGMAVEVEAVADTVPVPPLPADPGRPVTEPDVPIGRTEIAIFEAPPTGDAPAEYPIAYVAASSAGAWKPVPLELTLGREPLPGVAMRQRAILGRVQSVLAPRPAMIMDQLSSVLVKLVDASRPLLNVDDDALMAGANLALIGKELLQFGRADEVGTGIFRLSRLLRGRRGTEWAAGSHSTGEAFALVDQQLLPIGAPGGAIGTEIAVVAHGIGDFAPLPDARRSLTGEALRPPSPCHLRLWRGGGGIGADWVRRSHRGWTWIDEVGVPDDPFADRYRVTVAGPAGIVTFETGAANFQCSLAELPASPGETIAFSVCTIGPKAVSRGISASITI